VVPAAGVKDLDESAAPPQPKVAKEAAVEDKLAPDERRGILERILYRGQDEHRHFHVLPAKISHSKRAQRAIAVIVVAFVIFGMWWWVIPRADIQVRVQYHEGLFNSIAVDVRVINGGTVAASPMRVELVVTHNETGQAMGAINASRPVAAHSIADYDPVEFKGDQIETGYNISLTLRYDVGDGTVTKTLDFRTIEPFMNLYFLARVA
jgi:hypothetical protein